jgi:hypothetical protein
MSKFHTQLERKAATLETSLYQRPSSRDLKSHLRHVDTDSLSHDMTTLTCCHISQYAFRIMNQLVFEPGRSVCIPQSGGPAAGTRWCLFEGAKTVISTQFD